MVAKIEVTGLRDFQKKLRQMDDALPRQIRIALNAAAQEILDYARPRMPSDTGAARASLKSSSSQRVARIALGGQRAPYAAWLDFGGQGKRKGRPPARPFLKDGRYVYRGLDARRDQVTQIMTDALTQLALDAGVEMS